MDGNGRWAKKRILPRAMGHRAGVDSIRDIVRACGEIGVKYLTIYTFSSENWSRPEKEVSALMSLLVEMIRKEISELNKNNVRLRAIGQLDRLPERSRAELQEGISKTSGNTGLTLTLALSYGGRYEISEAARRIAIECAAGKMDPETITPDLFAKYLFDPQLPDPELLIRTGGNMRVSNFLLWLIAYSEIVVTDVLWPDFRREHLEQAIAEYNRRERRFGGVTDED